MKCFLGTCDHSLSWLWVKSFLSRKAFQQVRFLGHCKNLNLKSCLWNLWPYQKKLFLNAKKNPGYQKPFPGCKKEKEPFLIANKNFSWLQKKKKLFLAAKKYILQEVPLAYSAVKVKSPVISSQPKNQPVTRYSWKWRLQDIHYTTLKDTYLHICFWKYICCLY